MGCFRRERKSKDHGNVPAYLLSTAAEYPAVIAVRSNPARKEHNNSCTYSNGHFLQLSPGKAPFLSFCGARPQSWTANSTSRRGKLLCHCSSGGSTTTVGGGSREEGGRAKREGIAPLGRIKFALNIIRYKALHYPPGQ